ncbi:MAG: hypothetical protein MJZ22_03100 [Candidatus Saccharibacteria bacterium]|nr:hypothetical protein [Candidatus Saccharibacteria bacterium]
MGLFNNIKDHFTNAEFTVAPNKKVKTICSEFKGTFGCTLAIYKGVNLADGDMTINQLNQKTTAEIKTHSSTELKIKASMKVGDAEKLFKKTYGLQVQIKDPKGTTCVDNSLTIGQASRGESK